MNSKILINTYRLMFWFVRDYRYWRLDVALRWCKNLNGIMCHPGESRCLLIRLLMFRIRIVLGERCWMCDVLKHHCEGVEAQ